MALPLPPAPLFAVGYHTPLYDTDRGAQANLEEGRLTPTVSF